MSNCSEIQQSDETLLRSQSLFEIFSNDILEKSIAHLHHFVIIERSRKTTKYCNLMLNRKESNVRLRGILSSITMYFYRNQIADKYLLTIVNDV